ncbi:MAG: thiamine-phosphate kinase [bacterium]
MKLSSLGEFGLIDLLSKKFKTASKNVVLGIGDDCAAIRNPLSFSSEGTAGVERSKLLLITVDTLVESIHFKLSKNFPYEKLGHKALAVNISDIAAMGGVPTFAVISVTAPARFNAQNLLKIAKGINKLAKKHKISIVGGDTVRSPKNLMLTITLLGEVEKKYLLKRSGAKVGDAIMVTGKFGGPASLNYDIGHRTQDIRLKESRTIAKSKKATAMIDSSDGLVRSIQEVCKASCVGARINLDAIPKASGATIDQALYGGEEYELVFTGSNALARKIGAKIVGEIVAKKQRIFLIDKSGKATKAKEGFDHFK